jgi:hypothetical protein
MSRKSPNTQTSSKYRISADVCPFGGNRKTGWPMAITKVQALGIWKKSFMTCPRWYSFVLPLPFSEVDIHSFYSLSAQRVTHATVGSCSCVRYSPSITPTPGHYYIGLRALGQCPPHSLMKLMIVHTALLNGPRRKT